MRHLSKGLAAEGYCG